MTWALIVLCVLLAVAAGLAERRARTWERLARKAIDGWTAHVDAFDVLVGRKES